MTIDVIEFFSNQLQHISTLEWSTWLLCWGLIHKVLTSDVAFKFKDTEKIVPYQNHSNKTTTLYEFWWVRCNCINFPHVRSTNHSSLSVPQHKKDTRFCTIEQKLPFKFSLQVNMNYLIFPPQWKTEVISKISLSRSKTDYLILLLGEKERKRNHPKKKMQKSSLAGRLAIQCY